MYTLKTFNTVESFITLAWGVIMIANNMFSLYQKLRAILWKYGLYLWWLTDIPDCIMLTVEIKAVWPHL